MKIGIYLGDIKKPTSIGGHTFEMSFVDELLKKETEHEFVFYYFGKKNIFKEQENAKFVSLKYYKSPLYSIFSSKVKAIRKPIFALNHHLKSDKINIAYFLTPYLFEHIEIPYYAVIRDVTHRILPHFPEYSTNAVFEKKENKLKDFLKGASKTITCSEIAKNDIKTLYNIIDENIDVLPLPYPNWVKNVKENKKVLRKYNLAKNSFILYPAQFWAHKNHIRLILASQLLNEHNMNLKIVFTGYDRGNKSYLLSKVKEYDLDDNVLFLDYVEQEELATLYKNAFAVVYSSLGGADSLVALESMYFHCPVLISNNLGYIQQLKNNALYFNPLDERDIVEKLKSLSDVQIKDELLASNKLFVKENSCDKYIDKFINMMDDFYSVRQCWSLKESYKNK